MNASPLIRVAVGAIWLPVILLSMPTAVRAQAWTPARGEGTVSLQFQDTFVKYHQLPTIRLDRGHIRAETLLLDFTYGLTDKVELRVSLPYVASKYNGNRPHLLAPDFSQPNPVDNGTYHSTFQDFHFNVAYNISRERLVLTPFVGTIMPSHRYEYFAHSAVGRDLRELQVGTYWAKLLDAALPGLFVQGRYSYGFAQRILDISHNRSNLDIEAGYFVTPEFRAFALAAGQLTHGGVDLYGDSLTTLGPVLYPHHDQIARDNFLNLGGGAAYTLTPSVDVFGSVIHTAAGRNVHALQYAVAVGVTWSFAKGGTAARESEAQKRRQAQTKALAKCRC
jgi:hypothetical protein